MLSFVMSINATSAGQPDVRRSATAVKSCRYAFIVCCDGLRVARSIRKSANQFGVRGGRVGVCSRCAPRRAGTAPGVRGGDRRLVVEEAAGHLPSATEKGG
jgi:hypothetical protein